MPEKKKKIIYLVTQSEWGGAQKYVFDLATKLPKEEFEVLVAAGFGDGSLDHARDQGELFKKLEACHIPCLKLKHTVRAIKPIKEVLAFFELLSLFKKERPDIIHLNSSKIGILGSLAGKTHKLITNNKLLITSTVHGWVFTEPLSWFQKKLYYFLEKWTARLKDKIITVSEADRQIALKHKFAKPEKIITINNGLPTDINFLSRDDAKEYIISFFQNVSSVIARTPSESEEAEAISTKTRKIASAALRQAQDGLAMTGKQSKVIGTIANLYPTKGLNYLIEAAAILIKNYPDLMFLVIGDGQEKKNLELKIKNLGLEDRFFLLGTIERAYQYLKAFDVFVLPSIKEGWPYTLLEALAAGVPIIATTVGGVPEIIKDGENGLLVSPAAPDQLAQAIQKLLDDPDLANRLQQNALASSARFSLKEMVDKTMKIY